MLQLKFLSVTICFIPFCLLSDFSNDVTYIAEECLSHVHATGRHESLRVYANRNHLTDNEMAERLLFIADATNGFTNFHGTPLTRAAIGGIWEFPDAKSALPALEKYIAIPEYCVEAIGVYGMITRFNDRYFMYTTNAIAEGKLDNDFYLTKLSSELSDAIHPSAKWKRSEKSILRMKRFLANGESRSFDNMMYFDRYNCNNIQDFSNCIEHVHAQRTISTLLSEKRERIVKVSCYRGEWGSISDDEWYRRATNACQMEIARVMALPENERLNMTAILDAKLAAIEADEARAARREVWKRRLHIGALVIPIPVIALAVIVARKRRQAPRSETSAWGGLSRG